MSSNTINVRMTNRSDTLANWESSNPVLLLGEIAFVADKNLMKVGDGEKSFNELPYANKSKTESYYDVVPNEGETDTEAITRVVGENALAVDDIAIVSHAIAGGKASKTAYVYDGEAFKALDGNYNANNVYFDKDLVFTTKVGTVQTLVNGSATVPAAGKNVQQVLSSIFAKEDFPSKPTPTCSISMPQAKAYEAGTSVTPSYSVSFDKKSYAFGPTVAITPTSYSVSNGTDTKTTQTGSFDAITVGDSTNYKLTATVEYPADSAVPVSNLGNEYPAAQITAGSCTATSGAITSYRSFFYGMVDNTDAIDSALIRGLTNGGAYNGKKTLTLKAADKPGVKRFIVAYPANSTRGGLTQVLLTSTMNLDISTSYVQQANVNVEGVNGYDAVAYKLYVYEPAAIGADEVHAITLA